MLPLLPLRPLTVSETIKYSFSLSRKSLSRVLGLLGIYLLIVAGFVATVVAFGYLRYVLQSPLHSNPAFLLVLALQAFAWLSLIWFNAAAFLQINAVMQGQPSHTLLSAKLALKKLPALLMVGIICLLAFFCIHAMVAIGFQMISPLLGRVVNFCIMLFLGVITLFIRLLIVIDDLNPFKAIDSAWRLVRGNWWQSFIILLVPSLCAMLAALLFYFLSICKFTGSISTLAYFVTASVELLIVVMFLPLSWFSFILVQLHNLKSRYHVIK